MTTDRLVAYVTDPGYMLPTLVSACQLADAHPKRDFDIAIFTVEVDAVLLSRIETEFAAYRFAFIAIDSASYMPSGSLYFREGHVPRAALGRLVLSQYIPAQYEHIVYIDGDTQICGDLSALIDFDVPHGHIGAVSETFFLERPSADRSRYLAAIGLERPADYFNSGVLAFRNSTWKALGREALDFYLANPTVCEFHDQSALNAVCAGRRVSLPPAYNFHTGYAELFLTGGSYPRIVHFTGREKPWNYQAWPWRPRFAQPYRRFKADHPTLNLSLDMRFSPRAKFAVRSLLKLAKYRRQHADLARRRRLFRDYLRDTAFPF